MQAIILAAGKGTRMRELTKDKPKPMILLAGKTLLEHKFDALSDDIDEIVIVIGYLGHIIQERFGNEYKGKRIVYVKQETQDGTTGALQCAKDVLKDRFIVMMSDDLYAKDDIQRCASIETGWAVLVQEAEEMKEAGAVEVDSEGTVVGILEGNRGNNPGLANTNMFIFDKRIFEAHLVHKAPGNPEIGLPQTAIRAAQELDIPFRAIMTTRWFQITNPEDIQKAEEILAKRPY